MINEDLKKKAESDDPVAMRELAKEYFGEAEEAQESSKDKKLIEDLLMQSYDMWEKSALKGDAEAQHEIAGIARFEEDFERSFKFEKKSAEQGYVDAYYDLATHYKQGVGTDVDLEMGFYWYEKAAKNGDVEAKRALGSCYLLGSGTEKDFEKAFFWINQAAKEGSARAKRILGAAYIEGYMRLKEDKEKGWALMQEAADLGDQEAIDLLKQEKRKK
ncbi:tetratricopeptide repeat protein [Treponema sp. R80B11-R83G3]